MLDLLPKDLTGFDRPSSSDQAEYLAKEGVHRQPAPTLNFFCDESAEFLDFGEGTGFSLCWAYWECWAACTNQREAVLMMDPENPADSSNPHPFEIEFTGLLLEGWLVASS